MYQTVQETRKIQHAQKDSKNGAKTREKQHISFEVGQGVGQIAAELREILTPEQRQELAALLTDN